MPTLVLLLLECHRVPYAKVWNTSVTTELLLPASVSVRNPTFLGDLDLELEWLQPKLGIEIWNVECKNFLSGLVCGMGFYFFKRRIVEWE